VFAGPRGRGIPGVMNLAPALATLAHPASSTAAPRVASLTRAIATTRAGRSGGAPRRQALDPRVLRVVESLRGGRAATSRAGRGRRAQATSAPAASPAGAPTPNAERAAMRPKTSAAASPLE